MFMRARVLRRGATGVVSCLIAALVGVGCSPTAWNQDAAPVPTDSLDIVETVLPNGLRLVIHEDHRVPVVKVVTVVGVGSADEPAGRGGFAHLFEHLMFSGTAAVPQFDVTMEAVGGSNNAWTDVDQTVYHETAPAHSVNTLLWLEADRFANLGASISQEKIDVQRDVVLNEMRQAVLDEPGGGAYEAASSALFPADHPYYRPVIGSIEDLKAATRADVVDFFTRFYTPSNLTLIVVGDVDTASVRAQVARLHGRIGARVAGPDDDGRSGAGVGRTGARRCRPCRQQFVDAVASARVSTTYQWNTNPPDGSFVDPSLEVAAAMANDGYTSALQVDLVRTRQLANWVSFSYDPKIRAQMFSIEAEAAEGVSPTQLRSELDDALERLAATGFRQSEVDAVKTASLGGLAEQLEEPNGRADVIQDIVTRYGTTALPVPGGGVAGTIGHDAFMRYGRRFRSVTATSATRAFRKVIRSADRVEQVVLPGERGGYPAVLIESSGTPSGRLLDAPAAITFERPRDGRPATVRVPNPSTARLASSVVLSHFERHDAPTVEVVLMVNGGGERDPAAKEGRGALMAALMTRGAGGRDATELSEALGRLGSSISVNGSADRYTVSVSSPPSALRATLGLLADIVIRPTFDEDEVALAKDETAAGIASQQTDAGALAFYAGVLDYFPATEAVTHFATASSIERVTADDLRAEHRFVFQPQNTEVVSGGPLGATEIKAELDRALKGWNNAGAPVTPRNPAVPTKRTMHTVLVDVPDASQTQLLFFASGPDPADPIIVAADSSSFVLGGAFTSRLNRSLREEKGYTYGASAGLSLGEHSSLLQASTSVEQSVTGAAVAELLRIIRGFDLGDVTATETASATAATYSSAVGLVSTNAALVYTFAALRDRGLAWDQVGTRLSRARSLSQAELSRGAQALIDDGRVTLAIAGDLDAVRKQLVGLELGTVSETTIDLG